MRRREFISLLGGAACWAFSARAQQGEGVKRLGILLGGSASEQFSISDKQLVEGLAQLGWREARNLRVDFRLAGSNDPAIIRPHAESLIRAAPDVIYAAPATAVQVLQRLTTTIPIVFAQSGDPVQAGTVQSLARPGGNITGDNLERARKAGIGWTRPTPIHPSQRVRGSPSKTEITLNPIRASSRPCSRKENQKKCASLWTIAPDLPHKQSDSRAGGPQTN